MIGIYKIENKINKKVYIGQSTDIQKRWKDHINNCNTSKYNYAIYVAMRKYSIENFTFEILEECGVDQLSSKEKYWIQYFDSYNNGYNMTIGGDGVSIIDYQEVKKLWEEGLTEKEICNKLNKKSTTISLILKKLDVDKREIKERSKIYLQKEVEQYSLDGKYIKTFSCAKEAELYVGISAKNIQNVCNMEPQYKSAGGFLWKYKNDDRDIEVFVSRKRNIENPQMKKVFQYSLDKKLLNEYPSTGEASRKTNISQQNISAVCRGKRKTAGGYIWSFNIL